MNVLFAWLARLRGSTPRSTPAQAPAPTAATEIEHAIDVATHVAGATVGHDSPFTELETPRSEQPMHPALLSLWSEPFYLIDLTRPDPGVIKQLRTLWPKIERDIVLCLLAEYDWRPRLVAAYLIALKRLPEFDDVIGRMLLRSDVCFAGRGYCLALATSGSDAARAYLRLYLDYYLTRRDLRFDQDHAIAALAYLDQRNGSDHVADYRERWDAFVADKSSWTLEWSLTKFKQDLEGLDAIRRACTQ